MSEHGFVSANQVVLPNRVIISVEGIRGVGKTEFGLWGKPPVALQRIDLASEGALKKMRELREIIMSTYDYVAPTPYKKTEGGQPADKAEYKEYLEAVEDAKKALESFLRDYRYALREGVGTVVWDTATELYEIARLTRFGRLEQVPSIRYTELNKYFRGLINEATNSNTSLVMIHKCAAEWESYMDSSGREKSRKTGNVERKGFGDVDFAAHAMIRLYRKGDDSDPAGRSKPKPGDDEYGKFMMAVLKSNQNAWLTGQEFELTGIENPFAFLATLVFPDTSAEMWE